MISKNRQKLIQSLKQKKQRDQHGLFVAEGEKLVTDLFRYGAKIHSIYATSDWLSNSKIKATELIECSEREIKSASQLTTSSNVIALVHIPETTIDLTRIKNELVIGLDEIQDPGNLGTIIRMAGWFGINTIICSKNTVDCYNSKAVQATMGAIMNAQILYTDLGDFISKNKSESWPVYGTFLEGRNIYSTPLSEKGMVILGNEGKGISSAIEKLVDNKLYIPHFSNNETKPESLNVSVAASIICSEFRRRISIDH